MITPTPPAAVAPLMPAINVALCVLLPMRIVLDSPRHPHAADVDIVIASGKIYPGFIANRDVVVAGCVVLERKRTGSRVVDAGCVEKERIKTDGCVTDAGCVVIERLIERIGAQCGVLGAACETKERIGTFGGVVAGIALRPVVDQPL